MTRTLKLFTITALVALAIAAVATAASPIKGATYKGKATGNNKVTLKVSSTGGKLAFTLACAGGAGSEKVKGVKITDGKFTAKGKYFKATGKFVTRKKASGKISGVMCFLGDGATWSATKV